MNQLLDSFFWVNESTPSLYDAHYSVLVFELLVTNQLQLPGPRRIADEGTSSLYEATQNSSYILRCSILFFPFPVLSGSSLRANEHLKFLQGYSSP